ncbi:MAG: acyltransferase family protein, partial [Paraclostridium dentum]|uniref:acyltransferase family protein n=1 Tax=Paraclostridium dentum TaxID=2662455 RepID=UPI003EE4E2B3
FFFILSGFILSHSYGDRVAGGSLGFWEYAFLRLARLSPLHFATAVPFIFFGLYKHELSLPETLLNLFYLQSWIPSDSYYFSLNAPSWSLSNEMFFYFCFFPLAFVRLSKLIKLGGGLLAIVAIIAIATNFLFAGKIYFGTQTITHWLFYIFPGFRLLEFIVGMILYKVWKNGFRLNNSLIIPSYITLFCAMYFAGNVPESFRMSLFFLPFISLFFYAHLSENWFVISFFSCDKLILLGNSSFAFYLIHQPLIAILKRILNEFELSNAQFFVISLFIITFLSILVFVFYEKRFDAYLKSFITSKKHYNNN